MSIFKKKAREKAQLLDSAAKALDRAQKAMWAANRYNRANVFASYKRGTVDWKDSLVERPE